MFECLKKQGDTLVAGAVLKAYIAGKWLSSASLQHLVAMYFAVLCWCVVVKLDGLSRMNMCTKWYPATVDPHPRVDNPWVVSSFWPRSRQSGGSHKFPQVRAGDSDKQSVNGRGSRVILISLYYEEQYFEDLEYLFLVDSNISEIPKYIMVQSPPASLRSILFGWRQLCFFEKWWSNAFAGGWWRVNPKLKQQKTCPNSLLAMLPGITAQVWAYLWEATSSCLKIHLSVTTFS